MDPTQQPGPPGAPPPGGPAPSPPQGGGGPPPQGGGQPGGGGGGQVPPQMQRFIDPNNPLQAQLLQRVNRLPPQAIHVLRRVLATVPQLGMVLKQLFPEISFIFDMLARGQQQGQPGQQQP